MDGRANRRSVLIAASRQKRARKPSARERVDEFVHKHPVGVPVGFAATVLLGGAILGATVPRHAAAPRDTGHPPIPPAVEPVLLAQIYGPKSKRTPAGPASAIKEPQVPQVASASAEKAPEAGLTTPAASTPVSMAVLPADEKSVVPQTRAKTVGALYTEEPDAQLSCGTHLVVFGAKFPVVCDASGGVRALSVTAEESPLLYRWGASISVLECVPNATIVEIDVRGGGLIPVLALYQYARAHPDRTQGLDVMDETDTQLETMQKTNLETELRENIYSWLDAPEATREEKEARAKAHSGVFETNLPLVDAFARVYRVGVIVWECRHGRRATRVHPKGSKGSADLARSMDTHLNLRVASERYTILARF